MPGDRPKQPDLVPEVLRPGREQTGVAVLLVAASALAFALAGSAFALWARSAQRCGHHHPELDPAFTVARDAEAAAPLESADQAPAPRCGEAIYRNDPDGSVTVRFETCAETPEIAVPAAPEPSAGDHDGVFVYKIVY
jgi:hypothetical protein